MKVEKKGFNELLNKVGASRSRERKQTTTVGEEIDEACGICKSIGRSPERCSQSPVRKSYI